VSHSRDRLARLRGSISLNGVRTVVLLIAASMSISGFVYNYLRAASVPTHGELLTVIRDPRQTPLSDAQVEVLTLQEAPVASFSAAPRDHPYLPVTALSSSRAPCAYRPRQAGTPARPGRHCFDSGGPVDS